MKKLNAVTRVGIPEIFYPLSGSDPVILLRLILVQQLSSKEKHVGKNDTRKNSQLSLHFASYVLHEYVNVIILSSLYKPA